MPQDVFDVTAMVGEKESRWLGSWFGSFGESEKEP